MTAIAAWMITCILFVFLALVAYAWLLWKKKKSCLKRKRTRKMSDEEGKARNKKKEDYRSRLDDIFFVVFPSMFLLFNLIYWPMCLRGHEDALEDQQLPGAISEVPIASTPSPPGLPLGMYTNHWKKSVPHVKTGQLTGCQSYPGEEKCLSRYSPSEIDYDFQGIFDVDTEL